MLISNTNILFLCSAGLEKIRLKCDCSVSSSFLSSVQQLKMKTSLSVVLMKVHSPSNKPIKTCFLKFIRPYFKTVSFALENEQFYFCFVWETVIKFIDKHLITQRLFLFPESEDGSSRDRSESRLPVAAAEVRTGAEEEMRRDGGDGGDGGGGIWSSWTERLHTVLKLLVNDFLCGHLHALWQ